MNTGKEHVFQCDCHDFHFLTFNWYPPDRHLDLEIEGYIDVGGDYWNMSRWRERIKVIWRVIRNRHAAPLGLVLNQSKVIELRNALNEFLKDAGVDGTL